MSSSSYAGIIIKQSHNSSNSWWNFLIRHYTTCHKSSYIEAIQFFIEMQRVGAAYDEFTYPFLFKVCSSLLSNTLIYFYGSCKKIVDAYKMFDEILPRTVVSWNSIILACVKSCWYYDGVEIF
ncbi:hypothetical protein P3S68_015870 [Capsicum galapagoense]